MINRNAFSTPGEPQHPWIFIHRCKSSSRWGPSSSKAIWRSCIVSCGWQKPPIRVNIAVARLKKFYIISNIAQQLRMLQASNLRKWAWPSVNHDSIWHLFQVPQFKKTSVKGNPTTIQHTQIGVEIPWWISESPFEIRSVDDTPTTKVPLPQVLAMRVIRGFSVFGKLQTRG